MVEMSARRNLRHNAAIGGMVSELGMDQIRTDLRTRRTHGHHCGGGFVAAGFNAEDDHRVALLASSQPPVWI
jgi:hypothetical protein